MLDIVNSFDKIPTSESTILSESPSLSNDVRNHHWVKLLLFPSIESLNIFDSVHIPSINPLDETMALGMIDVAMSNICVWVNEDSIKDIAFVEHISIIKKGLSPKLNRMDLARVVRRRAFYNNDCWIISEFPNHLHEMFPQYGACLQYECYSRRMYRFIVSLKKASDRILSNGKKHQSRTNSVSLYVSQEQYFFFSRLCSRHGINSISKKRPKKRRIYCHDLSVCEFIQNDSEFRIISASTLDDFKGLRKIFGRNYGIGRRYKQTQLTCADSKPGFVKYLSLRVGNVLNAVGFDFSISSCTTNNMKEQGILLKSDVPSDLVNSSKYNDESKVMTNTNGNYILYKYDVSEDQMHVSFQFTKVHVGDNYFSKMILDYTNNPLRHRLVQTSMNYVQIGVSFFIDKVRYKVIDSNEEGVIAIPTKASSSSKSITLTHLKAREFIKKRLRVS